MVKVGNCKEKVMASRPISVKSSSSSSSSLDDEFYNNLTLNLIQFLNNIPRITSVTLHKQQPCERTAVTTFEQRHNVFLPDDMKRFYLSSDGFTLHWCYQYARKYNSFSIMIFISFVKTMTSFVHEFIHLC